MRRNEKSLPEVQRRTPAEGVPPKSESRINASMLSSLGIAIIVHLIIALSIGGYVVYEGIDLVPFFQSDFSDSTATESLIEELPTLIEEEPLPQIQSESVQVAQEDGGADAPDMSDLITVSHSSLAPSFSMPTVAGNPGLISGSFLGGSGSGTGTGVGKGKVKLSSFFGGSNLGSKVLTGYLYDFKQDSKRKSTNYIKGNYGSISKRFTDSWKKSELKDYYRSSEPLQLTQIIMPEMGANVAPAAFGVASEVQPSGWMAHYEGNITPPESGNYRLYGKADDVLIVRINGEIVLDASLTEGFSLADKSVVRQGVGQLWAGKWMKLDQGMVYPIEIVVGEVPGGGFQAYLLVEKEGVNYDTSSGGYPILPVFQMIDTDIPKAVPGIRVQYQDKALIFGAPYP